MVTPRIAAIVLFLVPVCGAAQEQGVGQTLYEANCAGCHGLKLEGQPDWMKRKPSGRLPAPPHDATGHTWHHSDDQLVRITLDGLAAIAPGYESDMPAFRDRLTENEVTAIFDYIKSTWPERQRHFQEARSAND
jgi:mono/diheme cytochrome c family protein